MDAMVDGCGGWLLQWLIKAMVEARQTYSGQNRPTKKWNTTLSRNVSIILKSKLMYKRFYIWDQSGTYHPPTPPLCHTGTDVGTWYLVPGTAHEIWNGLFFSRYTWYKALLFRPRVFSRALGCGTRRGEGLYTTVLSSVDHSGAPWRVHWARKGAHISGKPTKRSLSAQPAPRKTMENPLFSFLFAPPRASPEEQSLQAFPVLAATDTIVRVRTTTMRVWTRTTRRVIFDGSCWKDFVFYVGFRSVLHYSSSRPRYILFTWCILLLSLPSDNVQHELQRWSLINIPEKNTHILYSYI